MDSDKTIFRPKPPAKPISGLAHFPIEVTHRLDNGDSQALRFRSSFTIGRDTECDVCLDNTVVSRIHALVYFDEDCWVIRDLRSTNGIYADGRKITLYKLSTHCQINLGREGPLIMLIPLDGKSPIEIPETDSVTQFVNWFLKDKPEGSDKKAKIVREAFKRQSHKRIRKYRGIVAGILLLLLIVASISFYQYKKIEKMNAAAVDIFYSMKAVELQLLKTAPIAKQSGNLPNKPDVSPKLNELDRLRTEYDKYLADTNPGKRSWDDREKLIIKMARVFGECELEMPKSFVNEVKRFIKTWQASDLFSKSLERAKVYDFTPTAIAALKHHQLPHQFFYLGMAESGFRIDASGPQTRHGIAKGAWQFIPKTALRYGLKVGPLSEKRGYDPADERFDVRKSTYAAAAYLKEIYATDAQASGLLVMASYNWGEHNIVRLISKLPENPRNRNFWQLIKQYKIPQQTYDYVLRIFAAAVIGENPRLFGFDFGNPLAQAVHSPSEAKSKEKREDA